MREKLTRALAGLIAVAGAITMYADLSNFVDFNSWMDWGRLAGMAVVLIAFAVYAVGGTGPAHRILSILTIPDRITDRVLQRLIREEDHEVINLKKPSDKNLPR